jgi:hypothetical protein
VILVLVLFFLVVFVGLVIFVVAAIISFLAVSLFALLFFLLFEGSRGKDLFFRDVVRRFPQSPSGEVGDKLFEVIEQFI